MRRGLRQTENVLQYSFELFKVHVRLSPSDGQTVPDLCPSDTKTWLSL